MEVEIKESRSMKIKVQVVIESESGNQEAVEEVACLERDALRAADLGLTLAEAKSLLSCPGSA